MQYTISMTSRMLAISAFCAFLLCVLLFLLGIELGKRFAEPPVPAAAVPALPPAPSVPTVPAPAVPAPPTLTTKP
jgi:hypothetical protein